MTTLHTRKVKYIQFTLDGTSFECQVKKWKIANKTDDGDRIFSQCPDGEAREEPDDDYALELEFYADWRSDGISDFLTQHDGETVAFQLDHLYDVVGEHIRYVGTCRLRAPDVGDEARKTEMTEVTLPIFGKPVYSRP